MRVNAITVGAYARPSRVRNLRNETSVPKEGANVEFRSKSDKVAKGICGGIGAVLGGALGFCIGGPVGATIGAIALGAAHADAQQSEIDFKKENPNESWYDESDDFRFGHYDY